MMPEERYDYTRELDLAESEQDAAIMFMLEDSLFLSQCLRKGIQPDLFSGIGRQALVGQIYQYFQRYNKAPKETIIEYIANERLRKKLRKEHCEEIEAFLAQVAQNGINLESERFISDRLDEFVLKRIAFTAANSIISSVGTIDYQPERLLEIMKKAVNEADSKTGRPGIESIRNDVSFDLRGDILTRLNVPAIDACLGGGLKVRNFVLIHAYTSRGKSWCINHLAKIAARYGNCSLVIPTEMSNYTWRLRMKQSLTGLDQYELNQNPQLVRRQQKVTFLKHSDIFLLPEEEKGLSIDQLPGIIEELEQQKGKKIRLILMDSLDEIEPPQGQVYRNKIEKSTATYVYAKNYAKDTERCIVTTVQSQRKGETVWWMSGSTVSDDINKVRKATQAISINSTDSELQKGYARLYLYKNTDGPMGAKAWIKNAYERGQFAVYSERYEFEKYKAIMDKEGIKIGYGGN